MPELCFNDLTSCYRFKSPLVTCALFSNCSNWKTLLFKCQSSWLYILLNWFSIIVLLSNFCQQYKYTVQKKNNSLFYLSSLFVCRTQANMHTIIDSFFFLLFLITFFLMKVSKYFKNVNYKIKNNSFSIFATLVKPNSC